jgi:hypothetical protein
MGRQVTKKRETYDVNPWDPAARQGRLKGIGGSDFDTFNNVVANQAIQSLWLAHAEGEDKDRLISAGVGALIGIAPKDEIEGMLAAQMLAVHSASMECFRRGMIKDQTFVGRQQALAHGGKLSRTFAMLLDALSRHRGKGAQRIVVERVNVEAGGQAIVGAVTTGGGDGRKAEERPHAKADGDAPEPTMRGADAERDAMPIAGGPREGPVPDARRCAGKRRSARKS